MSGHHDPSDAARRMTDAALDRMLEQALGAEPSADFLARVRTRIASEPQPVSWRLRWGLVALGAAAAALLVVAVTLRERVQPEDVPQVAFGTVTAPRTATGAASRGEVASRSGPGHAAVVPESPVARSVVGATAVASRVVDPPARPIERAEARETQAPPETADRRFNALVLVSREDIEAFGVLADRLLDRRVDITGLDVPADPLRAQDISIEPIAIVPVVTIASLEGE